MNVLEVKNLRKQFGTSVAVNNISFSIEEGEVVGFLGPNGAGKTTTLQMVLGILTPSEGEIKYFGHDFTKHRGEILEKVNFSSTYTNLPWRLSVKENLYFISQLYTIPNRKERINEVVKNFHLEDILHKTIDSLSAGQTTRVNMAKAFINHPKLLLLDEPTASLDPETASYIRKFLMQERKEHALTILITSHNMAEVEELCDRIIFINHGTIIADDTPENLSKSLRNAHVELLTHKNVQQLIEFCIQNNFTYQQKDKTIIVDVPEHTIAAFLQKLQQKHITYDEISIEKPSLEDYFFQAVDTKITDMEGVL